MSAITSGAHLRSLQLDLACIDMEAGALLAQDEMLEDADRRQLRLDALASAQQDISHLARSNAIGQLLSENLGYDARRWFVELLVDLQRLCSLLRSFANPAFDGIDRLEDWEAARYIRKRIDERGDFIQALLLTEPCQAAEGKSGADEPESGASELSREAILVASLVEHPEWTDVERADRLGIPRSSIYRCEKYTSAKALLKRGGGDVPRGSKYNGTIEAIDEDL